MPAPWQTERYRCHIRDGHVREREVARDEEETGRMFAPFVRLGAGPLPLTSRAHGAYSRL
jgi:hypothetical protein